MRPGRAAYPAALVFTALLAACGGPAVKLAQNDPNRAGAELFAQRCAACHTLNVVGAQGSATKIRDRERVDGPNFNTRKEGVDQILYAIRNGGFSGAIMPENIVVGRDARKVAEFLAKYSGRDVKQARASGESATGASGGAGP